MYYPPVLEAVARTQNQECAVSRGVECQEEALDIADKRGVSRSVQQAP